MNNPSPVRVALRVGLFSFIIIGIISMTYHATKDKIADNEYQALLQSLQAVISNNSYDNNLVQDVIQLHNKTIYRARKSGKPIAVLIISQTNHGYNGAIRLLIAINTQSKILGVRVLNHTETPGLGDKIELKKSDWVLSFTNKSLVSINSSQWAVKHDGGEFDQFTGATITPRAIVNEVKQTALFFQAHQQEIFTP